MPQGELSRHLLHWKNFKLEPLSWNRRLSIALDVARGQCDLLVLVLEQCIPSLGDE
uniref:Uncharacterized protein n=1 Tax=Helianthus annuus TaxID=4232 RepID=A0A251SIU4_HELAN